MVGPRRFQTSLSSFLKQEAETKKKKKQKNVRLEGAKLIEINKSKVNNTELVLHGNPTLSDMDFIMETDFPSFSTCTSASTTSDAESAPPDLYQLFNQICSEYSRCVHETGRVLPSNWTMPELVRTMFGDEAMQLDFLTDAYYDVMLCGTHSWGCEELLNLLDLINYVF